MASQIEIAEILLNPLSILAIRDKQVLEQLDNLIPYSSAIEIECGKKEDYNQQSFESIPNIMEVRNDSYEQRYRIPNGIRGIICIYHISRQLKINSVPTKSSIHYHIDCEEYYKQISSSLNKENQEWILSELDTWLEEDTAHNRCLGSWFRSNSLGTVEFRLGEMTFDYNIMLKRIIHCNSMVKKIRTNLSIYNEPVFVPIDTKQILNYERSVIHDKTKYDRMLSDLKSELDKIGKVEKELEATKPVIEDILPEIKKRIHKLY